MSDIILKKIKEAGIMDMLIYLYQYPNGCRKVDFRRDLKLNPKTAIKAHRILCQWGFLKQIQYQNAQTYTLSDDGREIAKQLIALNNYLQNAEARGQRLLGIQQSPLEIEKRLLEPFQKISKEEFLLQ